MKDASEDHLFHFQYSLSFDSLDILMHYEHPYTFLLLSKLE